MRRGTRRGGGARSIIDDRKLRRRIDSAASTIHIDSYNVEQLVSHLLKKYHEYRRQSELTFTERVNRIVIEMTRRRNSNSSGGGGSSSSVVSGASTGSSSEEAAEDDEETSTYDLMKLTVRESLRRVATKEEGERKEVEEGVELEIDNNDKEDIKTTMTLMNLQVNEEGKLGDGLNKNEVSDKKGGGENFKRVMFKDVGGLSEVMEELKKVIFRMHNLEVAHHLGVEPRKGILLHGPPGCGKTKLAHAIANEAGVPFYKISSTELVSGISGASEENIRELFSKAYRTAPSIVFIDEIDAIASKRENLQRETDRRIVTQLMKCMDESQRLVKPVDENANTEGADCRPVYVLVIGATNRPDTLDPALRRPGRFDREIVLGVPNESARVEILSVITSKLRLEGAFDLVKIARSTSGFVGADLVALANEAGGLAWDRIIDERKMELSENMAWSNEELERHRIRMADFEEAAKLVQPSLRREGFSTIPDVKWDDVGGLDILREEFDFHIVSRIKFPEIYEDFGMDLVTGFLLYGPPGCGKTLIAKAVANEAGANFIHIKGPELLNKYVGESELAVRTIFRRARTCAPCLLFFDEVDALTTNRGAEGGGVFEQVLAQLLIELDGAEQRQGVYVIGATNRPEVMNPAFLRPGRFGNLMYVPLPSPDERGMILKALARKKPIHATVDLMAIGKDSACKNFSGADLSALIHEASTAAVKEKLKLLSRSDDARTIKAEHFKTALEKISPSVSDKQIQHYKLLSERLNHL